MKLAMGYIHKKGTMMITLCNKPGIVVSKQNETGTKVFIIL